MAVPDLRVRVSELLVADSEAVPLIDRSIPPRKPLLMPELEPAALPVTPSSADELRVLFEGCPGDVGTIPDAASRVSGCVPVSSFGSLSSSSSFGNSSSNEFLDLTVCPNVLVVFGVPGGLGANGSRSANIWAGNGCARAARTA